MLEFARWKYVAMALVLILSLLYSLPNLYPKDPAVQVSANRGGKVDQALVTRVETLVKSKQIATKAIEIEGENLVVRLPDIDRQTEAADLIRPELGPSYNVALNLASTVPAWLQAIKGKSMSMGLDLQGGVHFLLEVDGKAALEKRSEGYVDSIRSVLRESQIAFTSASRVGTGIV